MAAAAQRIEDAAVSTRSGDEYKTAAALANLSQTFQAAEDRVQALETKILLPNQSAAAASSRAKQPSRDTDLVVNGLLRKCLQYNLEAVIQATTTLELNTLHRSALRLKQMTLCHAPAFDLLTIAAYRLQLAAATGSVRTALSYVPQVVDAANCMLAQLLRQDFGFGDRCSLVRAKLGQSFFSHAIQLSPMDTAVEAAVSAAAAAASGKPETFPLDASMPGSSAGPLLEHGSYPVSEKVALSHFREDAVVLQSTRALYLKLLPSWLRVVSEAIDR